MAQNTTQRLTKSDWVQAGFEAMIDLGPEALKAEPLARRLGTTKGSFYWHFADVPAFHDALLSAWETQTNASVLAAVIEENTPAARLRRLGQVIADTTSDQRLDCAIRAWARGNKAAAHIVTQVDANRLAYLREFLTELDIVNPEMARIIYAASIGMQELTSKDSGENKEAIGTLVDLILALK